MTIKSDLKNFYDTEAEKYYYTRNKHWHDGEIILNEIKKIKKKNISILEFWCWWGRLIKFLNSKLKDKNIKYVWIDISQWLLDFAQKDNKKNKFVCEDIAKYIKKTKQESLDIIIWVASFQHAPNKKERLYLMKNFYKSLNYWWKLIMLNRSISKWFLKKHKNTIKESIWKSIYTLWKHNWRDLQIPWKNKWKTHYRFYHMFSKKELNILWKYSGFRINELSHIDKVWQKTNNWKKSNNTLFIWEKEVFNK